LCEFEKVLVDNLDDLLLTDEKIKNSGTFAEDTIIMIKNGGGVNEVYTRALEVLGLDPKTSIDDAYSLIECARDDGGVDD